MKTYDTRGLMDLCSKKLNESTDLFEDDETKIDAMGKAMLITKLLPLVSMSEKLLKKQDEQILRTLLKTIMSMGKQHIIQDLKVQGPALAQG